MDWMAERELRDEAGAAMGDPRRCPIHNEVISSPDGMFDVPCGACESEIEAAAPQHSDEPRRRIDHIAAVKAFVLAGNATFTLVSTKTGTRFTFKVTKAKGNGSKPHFVGLLSGPNNEADYSYLGCIWGGAVYKHGKKSRVGTDAPSAKAIAWFLGQVLDGRLPDVVEFWHEGRCGKCHRRLTVPESLAAGIGPICAGQK